MFNQRVRYLIQPGILLSSQECLPLLKSRDFLAGKQYCNELVIFHSKVSYNLPSGVKRIKNLDFERPGFVQPHIFRKIGVIYLQDV